MGNLQQFLVVSNHLRNIISKFLTFSKYGFLSCIGYLLSRIGESWGRCLRFWIFPGVNCINCIGKEETISFLPSLLHRLRSWTPLSPLIPPHSCPKFPKWKLDPVTLLPKFLEMPVCHLLKSSRLLGVSWLHMTHPLPALFLTTSILSSILIILKSLSLPRWVMLSYVSATVRTFSLFLTPSLLPSLHSYLSLYIYGTGSHLLR